MKKVILCFAFALACLNVMAFDFAGKTFKAGLRAGTTTVCQTVKFTSASRVEVISSRTQGAASVSDTKQGSWSVDGGNVVVKFDDGESTQYRILDQGDKSTLIHSSWGPFEQVKSGSQKAKSGSGKSKRKKR